MAFICPRTLFFDLTIDLAINLTIDLSSDPTIDRTVDVNSSLTMNRTIDPHWVAAAAALLAPPRQLTHLRLTPLAPRLALWRYLELAFSRGGRGGLRRSCRPRPEQVSRLGIAPVSDSAARAARLDPHVRRRCRRQSLTALVELRYMGPRSGSYNENEVHRPQAEF